MALKKRNKISAEFSMASMTDMIFLLLIFFMLTSSIVSPNALNLKLPSSTSKTVAASTLTVSITPNGKYYLNGKEMAYSVLEKMVQVEVSKSGDPKNTTMTIVADKDATVNHLASVMELAHVLRINAILATESK
ncbi:MAG: biopolymer transporter ExbD [Saprospiraceae bacterium]|jgi:biopolymer transport protein ExbD|nr:biopolymer transporter ExbD [Saprospiraceae bacterium]MBK6477484.1 biopolymer transporter ExbD [Saprospiraceae bacterium]MBK6816641.1 biopolymer transporter ExbD [Saprospiraceae bacterium]MBK7371168.1 biopolymer transporter ExbD [Saprospiraceae bacterium]MBK7436332.1 biopolymer transporter ExbD [Saprospiraceae bacterium]